MIPFINGLEEYEKKKKMFDIFVKHYERGFGSLFSAKKPNLLVKF